MKSQLFGSDSYLRKNNTSVHEGFYRASSKQIIDNKQNKYQQVVHFRATPGHFLDHKYHSAFNANYSHRQRRLQFEYKSFSFSIDNGGASVTIVEEIWDKKFSVSIDFGGIVWMIQNLKKAKHRVNEVNFFSKYQASYTLFLLQRYNN
ncbi:hypothetical protein LguiB_012033 [Lonicera macranthoides]